MNEIQYEIIRVNKLKVGDVFLLLGVRHIVTIVKADKIYYDYRKNPNRMPKYFGAKSQQKVELIIK